MGRLEFEGLTSGFQMSGKIAEKAFLHLRDLASKGLQKVVHCTNVSEPCGPLLSEKGREGARKRDTRNPPKPRARFPICLCLFSSLSSSSVYTYIIYISLRRTAVGPCGVCRGTPGPGQGSAEAVPREALKAIDLET